MKRRATTLIEVLAALVILGTTVVALVFAQARSVELVRASDDQALGSHLASELLANWRLQKIDVTKNEEGVFDSNSNWLWRRVVSNALVLGVRMTRIRVEILHTSGDGQPVVVQSYEWLERPSDEKRQE